MQRKLTVIMSVDMVGYSGLMEEDEAGTLDRLKTFRARIFDPHVAIHGGRLVKLMGDGALVEFASAVGAAECALAVQEAAGRADQPQDKCVLYRIGINLGEVIIDGDDIYGDGVNVAARLQALAPAGGIAVSRVVRDQIAGRLQCAFDDMGECSLKNIQMPVQVFAISRAADGALDAAAAQRQPRLSICVLPFVNVSNDPQQEYFSDGITDDIIVDLNKVSALSVVARNTAFTFKGKAIEIPQLARHLSVSHVLAGSVRKAGDRLRIMAQLADGRTGEQVWAERYDRNLDDIFALQDEIAEAIVGALRLKLLPEERKAIGQRGTSNVEAYNFYLMARQLYVSGDQGDPRWAESIIRLSKRATEIDPDYPNAWALLGLGQVALRWTQGAAGDSGMAAADRGLTLDPKLAEAYVVKARIFSDSGRHEEATREIEVALKLGQDSHVVNYTAGLVYYFQHRFAEAAPCFEKAAVLDELDVNSPTFLMACYKRTGDSRAMLRAAELTRDHADKVLARDSDNAAAMAMKARALVAEGRHTLAREWADRAMLIDPGNIAVRYNVAYLPLFVSNDIEATIDILAPTLRDTSHGWLSLLARNADFDVLRENPRFRAMVAEAQARLDGTAAP